MMDLREPNVYPITVQVEGSKVAGCERPYMFQRDKSLEQNIKVFFHCNDVDEDQESFYCSIDGEKLSEPTQVRPYAMLTLKRHQPLQPNPPRPLKGCLKRRMAKSDGKKR